MSEQFEDKEDKRHPSTEHMMLVLKPNPNLRAGLPTNIAEEIYTMAESMTRDLLDSPELTAGLRKLLEAKDCFVRCAVLFNGANEPVDYRDR